MKQNGTEQEKSMSKFKKELVSKAEKEIGHYEKQKSIKSKYHIEEDEEKIVVVKNNMIKYLFVIVRIFFNIVFFVLAVIGMASLIYPGTRSELIRQLHDVYMQLIRLLL